MKINCIPKDPNITLLIQVEVATGGFQSLGLKANEDLI